MCYYFSNFLNIRVPHVPEDKPRLFLTADLLPYAHDAVAAEPLPSISAACLGHGAEGNPLPAGSAAHISCWLSVNPSVLPKCCNG